MTQNFDLKTKLLNSWPKYWKFSKVPISNPPVFQLIYHVKFPQIFYNFIQAAKSKKSKSIDLGRGITMLNEQFYAKDY